MLITRSELRLALTAGLANAFSQLGGLPYGYYMPLAVLAVCTGSYGGSLALGRQRLLGSVLGAAVLLVASAGLGSLPLPLGIAIALGGLRLLGGALGLQVGYKVGGIVLVMGWVVHDSQLGTWVPLRLFWTALGILWALLSLRLFWPARALDAAHRDFATLVLALANQLEQRAESVGPTGSDRRAAPPPSSAGLRSQLVGLRRQMQTVAAELGSNPQHHPSYRQLQRLDVACSRLIGVVDGLGRQAPAATEPSRQGQATLEHLHRGEAELLAWLALRLRHWAGALTRSGAGRSASAGRSAQRQPLDPPASWLAVESWLLAPALATAGDPGELELPQLERIATRLMLCRQALASVARLEQGWPELQLGREASQRSIR